MSALNMYFSILKHLKSAHFSTKNGYFSMFCGSISHAFSCKHEMHDLLTLVSLYNAGKADSSILGAEKSKRIIKTRSRSDCVHEQVAKLGPVSRAAGMDCECPLYAWDLLDSIKLSENLRKNGK